MRKANLQLPNVNEFVPFIGRLEYQNVENTSQEHHVDSIAALKHRYTCHPRRGDGPGLTSPSPGTSKAREETSRASVDHLWKIRP
ncbi:hypothetical protein RRG08_015297 [Elysia crispata]|uniref:Uncharacterized protein n=1 Tax=Elysia crispata TaxID=231223 RepID=A0AAE0ZU28_9GAST|nr:hypothetical protein RRG08_015297 [Elysia crispata]